jgi:hypothetical protein
VETSIATPRTFSWRRLPRVVGPVALAIAIIVFLVARLTGNAAESPLPPAPGVNPPVANQAALTPEARRVATAFIMSAVARKDTGASWKLLDPTYPSKSEYTKATWARGDIPVIPAGYAFREDDVKLSVAGVYGNQLVLEAVIIPAEKNAARAKGFDLSLTAHGTGANRRWLVDYWMTNYEGGRRTQPK